ncbi:hypothetical protein ACQK5W_04420 [Pantoea sp. FN060301]|uniref:hypothetical protein n=1 Tax=Pantoea sp. FN060301 TaxID=3420380 RepID=UPI003D1865EA
MIDIPALKAHIAALEGAGLTFELQVCQQLLQSLSHIAELESRLATPVRLPLCSSSPVCEAEARYADAVYDCKEAIRKAGYPVEGDD